MITQQSTVHTDYSHAGCGTTRISWSAVFAGVLATIMISALFNLLGIALGLATYEPDVDVVAGIGKGEIIWLALSNLVAMFIGSWFAGRLSGIANGFEGAVHGFAVWSAGTLLMMLLIVTSVGGIVSGTAGIIKNTFVAAGESIAVVAPAAIAGGKSVLAEDSQVVKRMTRQVDQWLNDAISSNKEKGLSIADLQSLYEENKEEIMDMLQGLFMASSDEDRDQAKSDLLAMITEQTGINKEEAQQKINQWAEQLQQEKEELIEKAQQSSREVAATLSKVAFTLVFILTLSLLVAAFAGKRGATSLAHRKDLA